MLQSAQQQVSSPQCARQDPAGLTVTPQLAYVAPCSVSSGLPRAYLQASDQKVPEDMAFFCNWGVEGRGGVIKRKRSSVMLRSWSGFERVARLRPTMCNSDESVGHKMAPNVTRCVSHVTNPRPP